MPYSPFSYEAHKKFLLDTLRVKIPNADLSRGSFWQIWASGQARGLSGLTSGLNHAERQMMPDHAVGADLDHHASVFDIPRLGPDTARGLVQLTATSKLPDTFSDYENLYLEDIHERQYEFVYPEDLKREIPGLFETEVVASEPGYSWNQPEEAVLVLRSRGAAKPNELQDEAIVVAPGLVGGRDWESDRELSARIVQTLSAGRLSDTIESYRSWVTEQSEAQDLTRTYRIEGELYTIDSLFIHRDNLYPGRVYVIPLLASPNRIGPPGLLQAVYQQVEMNAPATVDPICPRIQEEGIDMMLFVEPVARARWDWYGVKRIVNAGSQVDSSTDRKILIYRGNKLFEEAELDDPIMTWTDDGADGLEAGMRVLINGEERIIGHVEHAATENNYDAIYLTEDLTRVPATGDIVFPAGPVTTKVRQAVGDLFDALGPLHKALLDQETTDDAEEVRSVLTSAVIDAVMELSDVHDVVMDDREGQEPLMRDELTSETAYKRGTLAYLAVPGRITVVPMAAMGRMLMLDGTRAGLTVMDGTPVFVQVDEDGEFVLDDDDELIPVGLDLG